MWEIITQRLPWDDLQGAFLLDQLLDVLQRGVRPPIPADCPADYAAMMRRCWAGSPGTRPAFEEILASDIFAGAAPLA